MTVSPPAVEQALFYFVQLVSALENGRSELSPMPERIVVSLHLRVPGAGSSGFLRRAIAAKKRAEAIGGVMCAWGPDSFAFDFPADSVEEAVDLALANFEEGVSPEGRFGSGIAFGDITRLSAVGPLAAGDSIARAWRLASSAGAGEVLVDERCPPHITEELRTDGRRRFELETLSALVLDTKHPFRRDTMIDGLAEGADSKVRVTVPPLPPILGLPRELLDRAAPAPSSKGEKRPSEPPPTMRTEARPADVEPASEPTSPAREVADIVSPQLPALRSAPSIPPPTLGSPLTADGLPRIAWPTVSEEHQELAAAARQALLKGNVAELERLSDELKSRGESDLAERMAGFVAWNRGAKAEGLRKLRAAADAETRPAHRVRALLAYGVALAASGRTDAALLAALGALARAREVADRQGEHVCARFLARLSSAAGYERAAATWAAVADDVAAHA